MNKIIYILLVFTLLSSCASKNTPAEKEEVEEEFADFYNKFHTDSLFQISRITFPLEGIPNLSDTLNVSNYKWIKEDWIMQKVLQDPNNEYDLKREFLGDKLVTETIKHKSFNIEMIRRFAYTSEGWNLIYYQSFNLLNK